MAYVDLNNKNLRFLNGLQSTIDTAMTSAGGLDAKAEGAFLLTSDTHRLYVGRKEGSVVRPVAVNEGIKYTTSGNLPNLTADNRSQFAGQFYYLTDTNVLAVASGTNWVQINPDTYVTGLTQSASISDGVVTVTSAVKQNNSKPDSTSNIKFKEGDNVTLGVTQSGEITISSAVSTADIRPTLSSEAVSGNLEAKIKVAIGGTLSDTTSLKAGSNISALEVGENYDSIIIHAADQEVDNLQVANNTTSGFDFTVSQTNGVQAITATLDPTIVIGKTGDTSSIKFVNGAATLNVPTIAQMQKAIDDTLRTADAMTFKGVITSLTGEGGIPAISAASNGDTYKIGGSSTITPETGVPGLNGVTLRPGDLIIAKGTEDSASGLITSAGEWCHVPSGDDLSYNCSLITNAGNKEYGLAINDSAGDRVGSLSLKKGTDISLSVSDTGKDRVITVAHEAFSVTPTTGTTVTGTGTGIKGTTRYTVPVVNSVTVGSNGHVTAYQTTDQVIDDTHNKLTGANFTATVATGTATVTQALKDNDGNDDVTSSFKIKSDSLALASINGEANAVKVDLVWGTF